MFRDQLTEDRIRNINRLHRELKIYFPEYMDAFGKIDGAFALEVVKMPCIPSEITELGTEGLRNIWHEAKLRGRGYSRTSEIVEYAEKNVAPRAVRMITGVLMWRARISRRQVMPSIKGIITSRITRSKPPPLSSERAAQPAPASSQT